MEIRLLGGFHLVSTAGWAEVGPSAQRVIAMLAVDRGAVQREVMAGRLWPELPQGRAMANLRAVIWRLPKSAGDVILRRGNTLGLGDVNVDLHAVVAAARRLLRTTPPAVTVRSMDELRLGRELLPGWGEDWVVLERERLRQLRLHALDGLVDAHVAAGAHHLAIRAAEHAVALEPLRESAHRALIGAYLASGNRPAAVHQYEVLVQLLREELDTAPTTAARRVLEVGRGMRTTTLGRATMRGVVGAPGSPARMTVRDRAPRG